MNAVPGQGELLFVHDNINKIDWLVDSGALYSIVPPTLAQRAKGPQENHLQAANGSSIDCYGSVVKNICLGTRNYQFEFVVANVKHHILGADFLAEHYLAPNQRDGSLIDLNSFDSIPAVVAKGQSPSHCTFVNEVNDPYYRLLDSYPDVLTPSFTLKEVKHGIRHRIPTEGFPVQFRSRRLNPEKLAVAKEELGKLEKLGICYRGKSEWASPLLVTTKPDGGWRVCGDYRQLNSMTPDDTYPVRTLQDFTAELQGKTIFSKIDLLKGYHQIPVADEDICKTAVITPFGLFVFPRTPFGLKNAGQDFQRLMDHIFGDVPHVFVYIDDILVASTTPEEHLQDLKIVLDSLRENGLVTNRKKCILGKSSLEFLGYHVDANGIAPLPDRVAAIRNFKQPTSVKELQRFLGMVNYYRRFIPRAAHHLHHLFNALQGKPKNLIWDEGCSLSFEATKEALAQATLLHHPRSGAHLALTTDASLLAVGGVLEQWGPKGWEPLSFYSSKLNESQQQWPPYDRELLGAFKAVRYFRPMIEGRPFTLFTDHLSLVPSVSKKTDPQTARQAYQLAAVAEYTTDFRYIQGKANVVADSLSRPTGTDAHPAANAVTSLPLAPSANDSAAPAVGQVTSDAAPLSLPTAQSHEVPAGDSESNNNAPSLTSSSLSFSSLSSSPGEVMGTSPHSLSSSSPGRDGDFLTYLSQSHPGPSSSSPSSPLSSSSPSASPSSPTSTATPPGEREIKNDAKEDLMSVINSIGHMSISMEEMARDQALDAEFRRISSDARTGLQLRSVDIGQRKLIVDISNGPARPFVPFSWRRRVFDAMHGLGHPGVERTRQTIAEKFVWPSMRQDVSQWVRECLHCQRAKVLKHVAPPIGEFLVPEKRFDHLNIDLVTLTPSNGYKHLLTIVDRFSRWPVAIPIKDMTVETVLDAFSHGWVANYGIPSSITTDRGSQFLSAAWNQLMSTWGIKTHTTTAYHPEANGLVERLHRRLKEALLASSHNHPDQWYWKLPSVLLSIRTTLKPDIGASPAELLFGEPISVPGTLLSDAPSTDPQLLQQQRQTLANLRLEVARLQPSQTSAHRRQNVRLPEELQSCTHVFIRKNPLQLSALAAPYTGPYRVLSRQEHYFRISIPGRGSESVALARLKPAVIANDHELRQRPPSPDPPHSRPRAGRPPRLPPPPTPSTNNDAGDEQFQPPLARRRRGRPRKNNNEPNRANNSHSSPDSVRTTAVSQERQETGPNAGPPDVRDPTPTARESPTAARVTRSSKNPAASELVQQQHLAPQPEQENLPVRRGRGRPPKSSYAASLAAILERYT